MVRGVVLAPTGSGPAKDMDAASGVVVVLIASVPVAARA
jgi:hypothetical protein